VVGGIFIKMLSDGEIWKKWAMRDKAKIGPWAPIPPKPVVTEVVPSSQFKPQIWNFTIEKPADGWIQPGFDISKWQKGEGGFGVNGTPGAVIGTIWKTDDIWLRREFVMPEGEHPNLHFSAYHDEDIEVYVNGVLALKEPGYDNSYAVYEIEDKALEILKPGAKVTLAVHCHQTTGGQGVDVGLVDFKAK
jgi:hypothetical protein